MLKTFIKLKLITGLLLKIASYRPTASINQTSPHGFFLCFLCLQLRFNYRIVPLHATF